VNDAVLPSSNDGRAKQAIVDFVESVTVDGPDFVEPADRIATFDYDGTLWWERPTYVQADFFLRRMREMIEADPALANDQPYKAVAENDQDFLGHLLDHVSVGAARAPAWTNSGPTKPGDVGGCYARESGLLHDGRAGREAQAAH
jgi:hypothetical protein